MTSALLQIESVLLSIAFEEAHIHRGQPTRHLCYPPLWRIALLQLTSKRWWLVSFLLLTEIETSLLNCKGIKEGATVARYLIQASCFLEGGHLFEEGPRFVEASNKRTTINVGDGVATKAVHPWRWSLIRTLRLWRPSSLYFYARLSRRGLLSSFMAPTF